MPLFYLCLHLLLSLLCFLLIWKVQKRPALANALGVLALVVVIAGFALERREDWAWRIMPFSGTGLVFLTNFSLEGVVVLFALMWQNAKEQPEKRRAVCFAFPLFGVSLWSYAWYFAPVPTGLTGQVNASGFCPQSSEESCSAAAATMLLSRYGINTTEAEMAELCLTRAGQGTPPLGLYRGLVIKAASYGMRPRVLHFEQAEDLRSLKSAAVINVGLKADIPPEMLAKMQGFGWGVGTWHTVVVMGADAKGEWIDIADPSNGKERWPVAELKYLWDGNALILVKK